MTGAPDSNVSLPATVDAVLNGHAVRLAVDLGFGTTRKITVHLNRVDCAAHLRERSVEVAAWLRSRLAPGSSVWITWMTPIGEYTPGQFCDAYRVELGVHGIALNSLMCDERFMKRLT